MNTTVIIHITYLISAILFILGLQQLSTPRTARRGNQLSSVGMLLAAAVTLIDQQILTPGTILAGVLVGAVIGAALATKIRMTAMPQLVAVLNGFGGGASALVAASEFIRMMQMGISPALETSISIAFGSAVGAITFAGSLVAFVKLQELISGRPIKFPAQQGLNLILLLATIMFGAALAVSPSYLWLSLVLALPLILGVTVVVRIGGADMPVVISLLNSLSGIAATAAGFVVNNTILIIAGTLVGASGLILTRIMAKAMNRPLSNVLFGGFGGQKSASHMGGAENQTVRSTTPEDAAAVIGYAQSVVFVPGYGLAVAQAQHNVAELTKALEERGVDVKFAIHPVAGRMPGHMNVLLAEANIPYDKLFDIDQINEQFIHTDVAIVIGANDVTNPAARDQPDSPLYGMPILNVDHSRRIVVLKRSMGSGFAGVDNPLFYDEKTSMLFGDAKKSVQALVTEVKALA